MISIDTNLLVRLFVNDDKKQARFAEKLIENNAIYIAKSVFLETEWVLRYTYKIGSDVIRKLFEGILGVPHITVEDPGCIIKAMQWYALDFDFADALHLASSQSVDEFATLDKNFVKSAKKINIKLITME